MSLFNFDPLVNLFKTRQQLEKQLSDARAKTIEIETALTHCQTLEQEIDVYIAQIKGRVAGNPRLDMRTVRGLERIKKDLPAIRAHWEKRSRELAA